MAMMSLKWLWWAWYGWVFYIHMGLRHISLFLILFTCSGRSHCWNLLAMYPWAYKVSGPCACTASTKFCTGWAMGRKVDNLCNSSDSSWWRPHWCNVVRSTSLLKYPVFHCILFNRFINWKVSDSTHWQRRLIHAQGLGEVFSYPLKIQGTLLKIATKNGEILWKSTQILGIIGSCDVDINIFSIRSIQLIQHHAIQSLGQSCTGSSDVPKFQLVFVTSCLKLYHFSPFHLLRLPHIRNSEAWPQRFIYQLIWI